MRLVVVNHITLDGVMQAPGRPDEDTRAPGERMGKANGGLLLGRRSYEDMLAFWNAEGGPYKDALNNAPKYVPRRVPRPDSSGRIRRSCPATSPPP